MKLTVALVTLFCVINIIDAEAVNPDFVITKVMCVDRDGDMCIDLTCDLGYKTSNISQVAIGCMLGYPMYYVYVTVDLSYKYQDKQYSLIKINDFDFCNTMKTNWTSKIIINLLDQHFNIHNCPYIGRIKLENYRALSKFEDGRLITGEFQLYIRVFDDKNRTIISPVVIGRLSLPRAIQMFTKIIW